MKKLYLRTGSGYLPIDEGVAEKYHLQAGGVSPFSHSRIVGQDGETAAAKPPEPRLDDNPQGELLTGEIAELENGITLSTSEIIDFSQGTDSSNR